MSNKPCPGTNNRGESCGFAAGWGVDDVETGSEEASACKFHGGASSGAPEGNQNSQTHALTADPKNYHENQSAEEREWIFEVSEAINDRIRARKGDVDPLARVLSRRIAIKLHIAANATEHVDGEGLLQTIQVQDGSATYEKEIPNATVEMLRNYDREIVAELKKIGVLDDPDSQQAEATEGLISILTEQ